MTRMTNFEDRPPPAVGAYWIKEEDYPALLKIFDDGNRMPRTWKEWLKIAEEMERGLNAYGHVVMRVHIDPKTFPDWCAAHGTSPGREGRKRFVVAAVTERYSNQILAFSISAIASSISLPMAGCLALACRCDQRAPFGTQNTFSARYSSGSSAAAGSSASSAARFASKALEMCLRKIRPSATCL